MIKAVIDRFEGDMAVLLVGDDGERKDVARNLLPKKAKEGHWLLIEIRDSKVISAKIDLEETARVQERIAEKLARLRRGDHRK
jgi:Protein of unknown function (DUF3006)